jgi:hypothetical protein
MYLESGFYCACNLHLRSLHQALCFLTNILNCTRHHESLLGQIVTFKAAHSNLERQ